jgi:hypothetical protein
MFTHTHDSYNGTWYLGFRDGEGVFRFSSGCVYDGRWAGDSPNGRGRFRWPSGVQLEATWRVGRPEPGGVFSTAAGVLYEGLDYSALVASHPDFSQGDSCGWAPELLDLFAAFVAASKPANPAGSPLPSVIPPPPPFACALQSASCLPASIARLGSFTCTRTPLSIACVCKRLRVLPRCCRQADSHTNQPTNIAPCLVRRFIPWVTRAVL